jgi:predicted MPP superfamily phosphohydrolase
LVISQDTISKAFDDGSTVFSVYKNDESVWKFIQSQLAAMKTGVSSGYIEFETGDTLYYADRLDGNGVFSYDNEKGLNARVASIEEEISKPITTEKIADKSITTEKIADKSITTEKIADKSITTEKIADKSITTEKIADKSITPEKRATSLVNKSNIRAGYQLYDINLSTEVNDNAHDGDSDYKALYLTSFSCIVRGSYINSTINSVTDLVTYGSGIEITTSPSRKASVLISNANSLVYNTFTTKWQVVGRDSVTEDMIVVYAHVFGKGVSATPLNSIGTHHIINGSITPGKIKPSSFDETLSKSGFIADAKIVGAELRKHNADIERIKNTTSEIPSYYTEEYSLTLNAVQSVATDKSFTVVHATDLHFDNIETSYTSKPIANMFKAISKLSKEYPLANVVMGGDYMQPPTPNTEQFGIDVLMMLNRWMSNIDAPKIAIVGNHEESYSGADKVPPTWQVTNFGLTYEQSYAYMLKKYEKQPSIKKANNVVFYMIDEENEVMYLYLSTYYQSYINYDDIKNGIDMAIAKNTSNYPIIVFNHYSGHLDYATIDRYNAGTATLQELIDSYYIYQGVKNCIDYIKDTKGQEIIAWIGGHCHGDWTMVHNDTVVIANLQSGILSASWSQDGTKSNHTADTANETAFSVLTINKELGKIYLHRFGLGNDREINYNNVSGRVGLVE